MSEERHPESDFTRTLEDIRQNLDNLTPMTREAIERVTETIGRWVTPIAESPLVEHATKVPGLKWVMAGIGQVNADKVTEEIETLRRSHPGETNRQLADRVITDTAWQGGKVGLIVNFIPPLALSLLALDVAAVSALQAEMIYRVAAIYGYSLHEPARRGEVFAIWGLFTGGSGLIKTSLSGFEAIPGIGMVLGATSNATLLYGLGRIAREFYESKPRSLP
ncbi:hypothetical protein V0288_14000 [Pannus brasiliensis CCIBt3594]|uniref:EcsC family protein n=1 Tax=Pannus brasiliensis CCIBt3594 TaxID=1427578 RepID=A0AAW9QME1_9CHRO